MDPSDPKSDRLVVSRDGKYLAFAGGQVDPEARSASGLGFVPIAVR